MLISKAAPETRRPWRRRILWCVALLLVALLVKFILHLLLPRNFVATGAKLPLTLEGGPFEIIYYCNDGVPKGVVILGTGDGGWSYWEENTAQHLMKMDYAVGGWDCRKFANTRTYRQPELIAGFNAAVALVKEHSGAEDEAPVWYGGWSTGAEQSVAAAATTDRPEGLTGLLLAAPGGRGRFGITTADLLGKTPQGPDSFALQDFAPALQGIRVVQFAAGLDPLDDIDWLKSLPTPAHLVPLPGKLHDMGNAGPDFQKAMDDGMAWTLEPKPSAP